MDYSQGDFLRVSQVRILYDQSRAAFLFPVMAALALGYILWPVSSHTYLVLWMAAVVSYSPMRFVLVRHQERAGPGSENTGKWLDLFTLNVLVSGLLWGMAAIILIPYRPDALVEFTLYNSLVLLILCGLVAGAAVSYSVCGRVLFFYAVPALVPPSFHLISLGDRYNSALGGFVLLYLFFISVSSFRLNRQYRRYMDMEYRLYKLQKEYDRLVQPGA